MEKQREFNQVVPDFGTEERITSVPCAWKCCWKEIMGRTTSAETQNPCYRWRSSPSNSSPWEDFGGIAGNHVPALLQPASSFGKLLPPWKRWTR